MPFQLSPSLPAIPPPPAGVTDAISKAWQTLQSLPWAAHAAAAAGLILGIALCLRGRDMVKPCFALLGCLKGAVIGFFAPPLLGFDTVSGIPAPYLGAGIGAVVGFASGIALYRFAMAITGSIVVGLAAFLIAGASMGLKPPASPSAPIESSLSVPNSPALTTPSPPSPRPEPPSAEGVDPVPAATPTSPLPSGTSATPSDQAKAAFKQVSERVRAFADAWWPQIKDAWTALTTQQQGTLVVAAVGGMVGGFLLGSLMPTKSAAAFTSLFGSAISLFCLVWLSRALDAPGKDLLSRSPRSWLIIWMVLAGAGLIVQVGPSLKRRKAHPPAPAPTPSTNG